MAASRDCGTHLPESPLSGDPPDVTDRRVPPRNMSDIRKLFNKRKVPNYRDVLCNSGEGAANVVRRGDNPVDSLACMSHVGPKGK